MEGAGPRPSERPVGLHAPYPVAGGSLLRWERSLPQKRCSCASVASLLTFAFSAWLSGSSGTWGHSPWPPQPDTAHHHPVRSGPFTILNSQLLLPLLSLPSSTLSSCTRDTPTSPGPFTAPPRRFYHRAWQWNAAFLPAFGICGIKFQVFGGSL